jgi:hypothetical protein
MAWPSRDARLALSGHSPPLVSATANNGRQLSASRWTAKANKRVQFGYGLNYMIDVEHAVIIDVEATPARTYDEVAATKTMIERTKLVLTTSTAAF